MLKKEEEEEERRGTEDKQGEEVAEELLQFLAWVQRRSPANGWRASYEIRGFLSSGGDAASTKFGHHDPEGAELRAPLANRSVRPPP